MPNAETEKPRIPAVGDSVAFFRHNLQLTPLAATITKVWPSHDDAASTPDVSVDVVVEDGSTHSVSVAEWGDATTSKPNVRWPAP